MLFKIKKDRLYITYKQEQYPVRLLTIKDNYKGESTVLIAPEGLDMAFDHKEGFDAQVLDSHIHYFIPDRDIEASGEYIANNLLDFKYEFIREEFGTRLDDDLRMI